MPIATHARLGAILAATLLTGSAAAWTSAGPPTPIAQHAATYRFMVGHLRITALSDGTVPQDLHALMTRTSHAELDALLFDAHQSNPVEASINAYLIEDGARRILVDTGSGELFGPGNGGKLVARLAAIGVKPEQIDDILITHVHTDHSGGLTLGGRLTFPNATVHVSRADADFFLDIGNAAKTGYGRQYFTEAAKTLKPYVDAGKVRTFTDRAAILPGITATLHPGHTPGSAFFVAESGGQSITFIGDIIHVAPVQFPRPSITIVYDLVPEQAARVRAEAFAAFAKSRTLVAGPHLPFPGVGYVDTSDGSYAWAPIEYVDRDDR